MQMRQAHSKSVPAVFVFLRECAKPLPVKKSEWPLPLLPNSIWKAAPIVLMVFGYQAAAIGNTLVVYSFALPASGLPRFLQTLETNFCKSKSWHYI